MSKVISMRLRDEQVERLRRLARRLGRTPGETSALLLEESLRQSEFGQIEFRPSPVGRQAYLRGSTLAVWEVLRVARGFALDIQRTAAHLQWPRYRVQAALNYAAAFPDEVEDAIADNEALGWGDLARQLPQAELFEIAAHREA